MPVVLHNYDINGFTLVLPSSPFMSIAIIRVTPLKYGGLLTG